MLKKIFTAAALVILVVFMASCTNEMDANDAEVPVNNTAGEYPSPWLPDRKTIEVTTQFHIPPLDLRGYDMDHFEVEVWFLDRINFYREIHGLHPYTIHAAAAVTSIEHSLENRDTNSSGNTAADGRTHQERHHRWFGYTRTLVTSAHTSSYTVADGPLTQEGVIEIVDRMIETERTRYFILDPSYYYIGIGFSIQENARGRLCITMASLPGQRAPHQARRAEERIVHRQEYLEIVRERQGWTPAMQQYLETFREERDWPMEDSLTDD